MPTNELSIGRSVHVFITITNRLYIRYKQAWIWDEKSVCIYNIRKEKQCVREKSWIITDTILAACPEWPHTWRKRWQLACEQCDLLVNLIGLMYLCKRYRPCRPVLITKESELSNLTIKLVGLRRCVYRLTDLGGGEEDIGRTAL